MKQRTVIGWGILMLLVALSSAGQEITLPEDTTLVSTEDPGPVSGTEKDMEEMASAENLEEDPDSAGRSGPHALFRQATALYQQEQYEEALQIFREVTDRGYESPDLYYNMGNAAFRSNSIGYAILYYEKALKLDPSHEDARHNLEFVSGYKVDAFDEVPEIFYKSWTRAWKNIMPERAWSILSMALFVLMAVSLLIYLFSRGIVLKKAGFFAMLVLALFFTLSLSTAITRHKSIAEPATGVITSPSVVVRSSPSESGTELFILHEGTRVEISEEVSGWRNIRIVDGREGWITTGDFEPV